MLTFEKFDQLIKQFKALETITSKAYEIHIGPEFFDSFYEVIENLMNELFNGLYTKNGVDLVLFEWLYGNSTPVEIDGKPIKLETTKDVYEVLEKYFRLEEDKG